MTRAIKQTVQLREIAPRLALQAHVLPTEQKVELVQRLISAGIKSFELTSFVRPDLVPGLADAEELFRQVGRPPGVSFDACVGNRSGLERAMQAGADHAWFLLSTDDQFARANTGKTVEEQLAQLAGLVSLAQGSATTVSTYLIAVFGGFVGMPRAPQEVAWMMRCLVDMGVQDWILADSGGYASPVQMREMVQFAAQYVPLKRLRVQVHDSRGMGLANIAALTELGISHIDTALAGSGAHPASPAAQVGGVCTEDAAQLLTRMGIGTGLDLNALIETANWFSVLLGEPQPGFTRKVGYVPETMQDVQMQLEALKAFGWHKGE